MSAESKPSADLVVQLLRDLTYGSKATLEHLGRDEDVQTKIQERLEALDKEQVRAHTELNGRLDTFDDRWAEAHNLLNQIKDLVTVLGSQLGSNATLAEIELAIARAVEAVAPPPKTVPVKAESGGGDALSVVKLCLYIMVGILVLAGVAVGGKEFLKFLFGWFG